jgi:DNA-directed RNA polymerase alpha subunit
VEEYFELPIWLESIESINSFYINVLKEHIQNLDVTRFDLNILRELHTKERDVFYPMCEELKLRGFRFITKVPSNFFPENNFKKDETLILANNNSQRFEHINYSLLDMNGFIEKFKIEDDRFFNFVPIKGFLNLNKGTNEGVIISEFQQNGYLIKSHKFREEIENKNEEDLIINNQSQDEKESNLISIKSLRENPTTSIGDLFQLQINDFNIHICSLSLSNRTKNCLFRAKIFMLSEILNCNYTELMPLKNFGENSLNEILKFIDSFLRNPSKINELKKDLIINKFSEVKERSKELSLSSLNIEKSVVKSLKNIGIQTIDHLIYTSINELKYSNQINESSIQTIWNKINSSETAVFKENSLSNNECKKAIQQTNLTSIKLENSMKIVKENTVNSLIIDTNSLTSGKYFEELINGLYFSENDFLCITQRYINHKNLKEIGKLLGVTKERVRQILDKIEKRLFRKIFGSKFLEIIENSVSENFISYDSFFRILGKYADQFIHFFIQKDLSRFFFFEELEIFIFEDRMYITDIFLKLQEMLPQFLNLEDYREVIQQYARKLSITNYPENKMIIGILKYLKYKKYGLYFSKRKLSLFNAIDILFRDFIKVPFLYNEENFIRIKSILKEKIDFNLTAKFENIERSAIGRNEDIILVGKRTYINKHKVFYEPKILEIAYDYLQEMKLIGKKAIKINEVFSSNEVLFKKSGIENEYVLYSLIKENYSDDFLVGKGNTLKIFFYEGEREKTYASELKKYLLHNNFEVAQSRIEKDLKWDDYKIPNILVKNPCFMKTEKGTIRYTNKYFFDQCEKTLIDPLVNTELESYRIYNQMTFNNKQAKVLNDNKIESEQVLAKFLKNTYPNLKGHSKILFDRDSEYNHIDECLVKKFSGIHKLRDFEEFLAEIGYTSITIKPKIENLIKSGIFVLISYSEIATPDQLNFKAEIEAGIFKFIESKFGDQNYLILDEISGYRKLPKIDLKWNKHVIKYILLRHNFHEIQHHASVLIPNKTIICREKKERIYFDEFVAKRLTKEYQGNMNEEDIYEYLVSKSLINPLRNEYSKNLPVELKKSELFDINEIGQVKIKVLE